MAAMNQARAIAEDQGDKELEIWVMANSAEVNFFNLSLNEVLADGPNMQELGTQVDNHHAEAIYHMNAVLSATVPHR
jgi:hypothetical protein